MAPVADGWSERIGDFLVGLVSPAKAAVRKHWRRIERDTDYRAAYELALRVRGYKSASSQGNQTPWLNASNRSADAEILGDLETLRNRSRAANRDDAIASGITGTLVRGVVGTGLRPQARTGDDDKDDALEAVWADRADFLALGDGALAHGAHQRLVYSKRIEDGEIFIRPAVAEDGEPLWLEAIEADRVATPTGAEPQDPEGRIVQGIEKDRYGRVVAYWIAKRHPGESILPGSKFGKSSPRISSMTKENFDRVEARFVRHDRSRVTRPGQTRGVPICHAILQDLRDLDLLILAALKRTQVAACLAIFLKSDTTADSLLSLTAEDYGYQLDQSLEPGMIFRLFPGEEMQVASPPAGLPNLGEFVFVLARRIGAAVGLSPQAVLRAWEGINYSGARTIKIDDKQTFRAERSDFSATLSWEWRIVLEDELLRGNPKLIEAGVTIDDLRWVEWIGDEEQWVDPQAEATAIETMLRLGLTTLPIECARLGRDWQENVRQRLKTEKFEAELREEMGLPPIQLQESSPPPPKVLPSSEDDDMGTEDEQGKGDDEAEEVAA